MSEKFPVRYDFAYRSEMNEFCAVNLRCIDREAAYNRARYDLKNTGFNEAIYIEDNEESFTIKFDVIGELSGTLEVINKKNNATYSYHFENFFDVTLEQFDHKKGECRPMNYLFSKSLTEPYRWVEREFSDRSEVIKFVEENRDELKPFAVYESGNIYGYAVELSEEDKPQAILYPHKVAQLIWIDMG